MDQPGPSGSGEPNAKRRKEHDEHGSADDAVAIAPGEEQTADIFKLDIDCFEEAFDYLPVEDLVSVGKTCKRLQQVAGHCFSQNYSGKTVHISKEGINIHRNRINRIKSNVQHFAPFIQRIAIDDENGLRYFIGVQSKFRRLKQIEFWNLKSSDMDRLKKISMGKLEELCIRNRELNNDFVDMIDQCANLRYLDISFSEGESNWFNRKYPTLEYFGFRPSKNNEIIGIPAFLELNPNIRKFKTNVRFLRRHRDTLKTANIKLDDLVIFDIHNIKSICYLLDDLHALSFYRKLELRILKKNDQEDIDRLASLNGLKNLRLFSRDTSSLTFSALNNLEELHMHHKDFIVDIDNLPNALTNLKRIHFNTAGFDSIMPFIERSVEMHTIRVEYLKTGVHFNRETGIIDLPALNRERALLTPEQVASVQKVTLYVSERIYLATKWAFGETDQHLGWCD